VRDLYAVPAPPLDVRGGHVASSADPPVAEHPNGHAAVRPLLRALPDVLIRIDTRGGADGDV